jgi:hypothetical protein
MFTVSRDEHLWRGREEGIFLSSEQVFTGIFGNRTHEDRGKWTIGRYTPRRRKSWIYEKERVKDY